MRFFRSFYIKEDTCTGIGIAEYKGQSNETIAIYSLYEDKNITNREAQVTIYQTVRNELKEEEQAKVYINRMKQGNAMPYRNTIKAVFKPKDKRNMQEVRELANDAIKRQSNIRMEFLNEPMFCEVNKEADE